MKKDFSCFFFCLAFFFFWGVGILRCVVRSSLRSFFFAVYRGGGEKEKRKTVCGEEILSFFPVHAMNEDRDEEHREHREHREHKQPKDHKNYKFIRVIGIGGSTDVWQGQDTRTNEFVALKVGNGVFADNGHEKNMLLRCAHPRIVRLLDWSIKRLHHDYVTVDTPQGLLSYKRTHSTRARSILVLEFYEHDLRSFYKHFLDRKIHNNNTLVMWHLRYILEGVAAMHERGVLHLDLKPENILVSGNGERVVLTDLGLACCEVQVVDAFKTHTPVTPWYRAPEIMLGNSGHIAKAVDMWSVGCIFAELLSNHPLFPGDGTSWDQLMLIFSILGTPNAVSWPEVVRMPHFSHEWPKWTRRDWSTVLKKQPHEVHKEAQVFNLLDRMLEYEPSRRITAQEALKHPYFSSEE